jgi:hypothetical protein
VTISGFIKDERRLENVSKVFVVSVERNDILIESLDATSGGGSEDERTLGEEAPSDMFSLFEEFEG